MKKKVKCRKRIWSKSDGFWRRILGKEMFYFAHWYRVFNWQVQKKILDVVVMSSYCRACDYRKKITDAIGFAEWYEKHKANCSENHEGSAGKMEVQGVVKMFLRSLEKYAVRYGFYIGDDNSKTFKMLLNTYHEKAGVCATCCQKNFQTHK